MDHRRIVIQIVVGVAVLASAAPANTIYVDDDNCPGPGDGSELNPYCSIQTAIDNAAGMDEIVVAPGTYYENIDFIGKAVTLRSSDGPSVTTIDADYYGTVVTCDGGEGPDTVLEGFNLANGDAVNGGGMYIANNSNPQVINCNFADNVSGLGGGGMYIENSSPTVTDCSFGGNTSYEWGGGGMYCQNSDPTVTGCMFYGNLSWACDGGAMHNSNSSPAVTGCTFGWNTAGSSSTHIGCGGGMYNLNSNPTVAGCTFIENTAWSDLTQGDGGGGMYNDGSSPTVINCTLSGNQGSGCAGGAMYNWAGSSPAVVNCTLSGNAANLGNALAFDSPGGRSRGGLFMANCILWDGGDEIWNNDESTITMIYSDVQGGWPGSTNIDADPLFVSPVGGDLHLLPGSPCIDAGHNWAIAGLADTDLDGNPRFSDGPLADTGCGIPVVADMGAYEYQSDPFPVRLGDIDGNGVVNVNDFLLLLALWGPCLQDCCLADFDLDGDAGANDFLILLAGWG